MERVKIGEHWVKNIFNESNRISEIHLTNNLNDSIKVDNQNLKRLFGIFNDVKVVSIQINETDITELVYHNL